MSVDFLTSHSLCFDFLRPYKLDMTALATGSQCGPQAYLKNENSY